MLDKAFAAVDLFGVPILLNFSKSQKAKSSFGGFCSLLFLAFVFWSIYNSGYEIFARRKPQIIDGTTYSETPRLIEISSRSLPLAFSIQTSDSYLGSENCTFLYFFYSPREDAQTDEKMLERCTPKHFDREYEIIDGLNISNYYCLPQEPQSMAAESLIISAFCRQEANFFEKAPSAVIIYPKNGMTLHDYDNPLQTYYDNDIIPLLADTAIISSWSINHLSITTDDGLLATNENVRRYIQVSNQKNRNYQNLGVAGVGYEFTIARQESYYLRSYKRIQNVLAEVGGIANVAFTIILILITPYSRIKFSEAFVNELFEIRRKKGNSKMAAKPAKSKKDDKGTPQKVNSVKPDSKTSSAKKTKESKEIELQTQNTEQSLPSKDEISVEKESKSDLSDKRKGGENPRKSPRRSETEGLLLTQEDEETKIPVLVKPKIGAKSSPHSPRFSYRKAHTQPVKVERNHKGYRKTESLKPIELDDLVLKLDGSTERKVSPENRQHTLEDLESNQINIKIKSQEELDARTASQSTIEFNKSSRESINRHSRKVRVYKVVEKKSSEPIKKQDMQKSESVSINVFEYMWSFVSRSTSLRAKMLILNEGLRTVDERLDIFSLLKKLRDIDKIKAMIFDQDQLFLFDRTSRPEILSRATHWYMEDYLPYDAVFECMEDKIIAGKKKIREKPEKSQIDYRLLNAFSSDVC